MNRLFVTIFLLALTTACADAGARLADVSLIDRDNGALLVPHYYRGEYWVAGRPGARYAIEIHNRLGERVLAVTSVDGVNVVSGETAGWDQNGYVFGPGERYQIDGWRKSDAEVAAFTFTNSGASYASRTGRPANVGVIGVALFRERPEPVIADGERRSESAVGGAPPSPSARANAAEPVLKLGTGHGAREFSYVDHTEFLRMQEQPNQVIRIHYDSLDNLFARGIVKRQLPQPLLPNPFPGSGGGEYVPDPPG